MWSVRSRFSEASHCLDGSRAWTGATRWASRPSCRRPWWRAPPCRAGRPLGEPPPDDLLGGADAQVAAVDVRGVEEVDAVATIAESMSVCDSSSVGVRPEVHGAQAQAADDEAEAADVRVLHGPESTSATVNARPTPGAVVGRLGERAVALGSRAPGRNIGATVIAAAQRSPPTISVASAPKASASGPTSANEIGSAGDRDHPVEARDPAEQLGRDQPLQQREPDHDEHRDRRLGDERDEHRLPDGRAPARRPRS